MQAVIEAADTIGADRIIRRRGNVYSTGVYINNESGKTLLYNDWEKELDPKRVYDIIMASIQFSFTQEQEQQLVLLLA